MEQMAQRISPNHYEDHVTVYDTWRLYHGSEATEGFGCPHCGNLWELGGGEALYAATDQWWRSHVAPDLTCPACGATSPMDHWDLDRGLAVGTLAITMELWDKDDEFRDALTERFPGRWAGIYEHL